MAVAAVGVFAAYTQAKAAPATSYIVATRDISPGERLERQDVALVAIELPPEQRGRAFEDPDVLIGATTLRLEPPGCRHSAPEAVIVPHCPSEAPPQTAETGSMCR